MTYRSFLVLAILCMGVATTAHGAVVINEIAWMGTIEDATNEWIELYNNSSESVVLDGWSIVADDGAPSIQLSGTIEGNGFFLIERTDDNTLPNIPADLVASFGTGLGNAGERLRLFDANNAQVDDVNGLDGWTISGVVSGNNQTKETAQRSANGWFTGTPTPKQENSTNSTQSITETTGTQTSPRTGGSTVKIISKTNIQKQKIEEKSELKLTITAPKTVYVNQPVVFQSVASGVGKTIENSLKYVWNFGDTHTGMGNNLTHTFKHAGEYIIFLEGTFGKQYATVRHEMKVLPVSFTLIRTETGDIRIENKAPHEVDLGGFTISGTHTFTFPKFTILKSKGALVVDTLQIGNTQFASLYDNAKVLVASVNNKVTAPLRTQATLQTYSVETEKEVALVTVADSGTETPAQTVIQIGASVDTVPSKSNIFVRLVGGFARLFGL